MQPIGSIPQGVQLLEAGVKKMALADDYSSIEVAESDDKETYDYVMVTMKESLHVQSKTSTKELSQQDAVSASKPAIATFSRLNGLKKEQQLNTMRCIGKYLATPRDIVRVSQCAKVFSVENVLPHERGDVFHKLFTKFKETEAKIPERWQKLYQERREMIQNLDDNVSTNELEAALERFPNLDSLSISGQRCYNETKLALLQGKKIRHLSLQWTEFTTEEGLAYVKRLPLVSLNLCMALGSKKATVQLQGMAIQELDLSSNNKSVDDSSIPPLSTLHQLRKLNLSSANITNIGIQFLIGLKIEELDLSSCRNVDDACMSAINKLPLRVLHLESTSITNVGLHALQELRLEELNLMDCEKLSDVGMQYLQKFPLKKLNLIRTKISHKGLTYLEGMAIEVLYLNQCREITDVAMRSLNRLRTLTTLDLCSTNITDVGLQYLVETETALRDLDLSRTEVTHVGIKYLEGSRLTKLELRLCNKLTDEAMKSIATLPLSSLNLYMTPNISDAGVNMLAGMKKLEYLRLMCCNKVTNACKPALRTLSSLRKIDIYGTRMTTDGFTYENFSQLDQIFADPKQCR